VYATLADGMVIIWMGGVLIVGLVGFVVVTLVALARAAGAVVRMVLPRASRVPAAPATDTSGPRLCDHPRCGHLNAGTARFCARCGGRLDAGTKS
jgi:hypothetical protein